MAFNLFMHERNIYKQRPDFKKIATEYPEFRVYAVPDKKGRIHMDFNDQDALRMLTKILLKKDFNLDVIIPNGFLIPTIPQRLNYLLWIEDLLNLLPKTSIPVSGIDIGTGPCAIFSLLGAKKNNWTFLSTETSDEAIQWAEKNIKSNNLNSHIKVIQVSKDSILDDVLLKNGSHFDFCLCNPPFFENIEEIKRRSSRAKDTLAATAKKEEILAEGGEVTFVKNIIRDSIIFKDKVSLYTSMFGRKKSFLHILKELQSIKGISYTKTEFCQGNTIRWGVAWSFLKSVDLQRVELPKPKKPKKAKAPLLHKLEKSDKETDAIKKLAKKIKSIFLELEILFKVIKSADNYAEIQITAHKNTWSHQRRKRREFMKDTGESSGINSINSVADESKEIITNSEFNKSATDESGFLSIDSIGQTSSNTKSLILGENNDSEGSTTQKLKIVESSSSTTDSTVPDENSHNAKLVLKLPQATESLAVEENATSSENKEFSIDIDPVNSCITSQLLDASKKRKREDSDIEESSVPQKIKIDNTDCNEFVCTFQPEGDCPKELCTESKKIINRSDDSSNQNNSESCNKDIMVGKNRNKKKEIVKFEPSSLLYCILKLRKSEDHILLEMNCPPEANRESMHQIFQFIKNKISISS